MLSLYNLMNQVEIGSGCPMGVPHLTQTAPLCSGFPTLISIRTYKCNEYIVVVPPPSLSSSPGSIHSCNLSLEFF